MMAVKFLILLFLISGLKAVPLLMSWTTSIKYFEEMEPANVTSVTPTISLAIAVDYHFKRGEIYFSDSIGRIHRGWFRSKNEPITIAEVQLADGLAVDWIHNNLYWTDFKKHTVEMSTLDGLYRRVLFNATQNVEKPRAIVLDPFDGLLFWSDWGSNARIETSGLNGLQREIIVSSNIVWPNGLALDINNKRLYILDGFLSTISSCNYDGSNLSVNLRSQETLLQAFGLTFFSNKLFWTSWRMHTVFSIDVASENTQSVFKRKNWRGITERLMGIKAVHSSLQRPTSGLDPCTLAGCSHNCLTGPNMTFSCICPYGFKLNSDGKNCIEEGYLLVSWRKTIRRYSLSGKNEEAMLDATKAAIGITYHFRKGLIFWSDIEEHRIYRAPLGQLNNKTIIATSETCDGLAVDWIHDVIYWTDTEKNTLQAAQLDGSEHEIIISEHLDQPRDIVIDPFSRLLFWTDWGENPKIERAVLDGSDRKTIISEGLGWPNGMTIDFDHQKIYWVDGKFEIIGSSSYDGSGKKVILSSNRMSLQPFSMTLFQDKIYWTDWRNQALYKCDNKDDIEEIMLLANSSLLFLRPNAVRVVHSSLQKEQKNPCDSLKCNGLCLGSTTPQGARCIGEQTQPTIKGTEEVKAVLDVKLSNDSMVISLIGSKTPSLVAITTKCIRREGCAEDIHCSGESENTNVFSNTKTYKISGLLPASHYDVDFKSIEHNENLKAVTLSTDPPEIPSVKSADVRNNTVTIKWDPVDSCIPGFQSYHYKLIETGPEEKVVEEGSTNVTEITFVDLPGANFTIQVYTYDPQHYSSIAFSTGLALGNCIVYKKNTSEVYFRCDVNNKSVKQLFEFDVIYNIENYNETNHYRKPATQCIMWPEAYCFKISSLKRNKMYNFNISVVLTAECEDLLIRHCGMKSMPFTVSTATKEEVSQPPENVHIANYNSSSVVIQWQHPNQSNGIIRNFIVNIDQVETHDEGKCCQSFPIIEPPAKTEELVYSIEMDGLLPASMYAISVAAKTLYVGGSRAIDAYTAPPPMEIMKTPRVVVASLLPLSWQPNPDIPTNQPQYHDLIKSYILLLLLPQGDQETIIKGEELGLLHPLLESKIRAEFVVLWNKNADDAAAFQEPISVRNLLPRKQYEFAWVQVSQYKEAYGIDFVLSDPFIAI